MSDGGNSIEIAKNIGIIASLIGFLGTAIKAGQWKGEHEVRLKRLESVLDKTVDKLSKMDERVDGIEKELLLTMTAMKKDVEYIKVSLDDLKAGQRNAQAQ
jgi:vacuolar-type H+-ATPase subunit D/Vma8